MRPSILHRIKAAIAAGIDPRRVDNSNWDFESSYARRRPGAQLQSSDADANYGTRESMMSDARDLCRIFGVTKRILRQYANYTVGTCEVDFNTGNDSWDEAAEQYWRDISNVIDARGRLHLRGMAKLAIRSMVRDGDVAFIKAKLGDIPQLIPVEADRIRTNLSLNCDSDDTVIGGVTVDGIGRPQSYRVWDRSLTMRFKNPKQIAAGQVLHMLDPDRFDGVRGITHFAGAALNHMRDIKEIVEAEKRGVKVGSKLAMLIKKLAGGPMPAGINLFGQKGDQTGNRYTEEIPDGVIKYLLPGEDVQAFQSNRPSAAWTGFMEWLIREIAVALDLPYGWVWTMSGLTGPAVRLESKQAENTFNHIIELLEFQFLNPLCAWVITDAMENKRMDWNPFWYQFSFQRPSHPSIDIGRESKADLEEHARGWTSGSAASAARGTNYFRNIRQKAREYRYVLDTAKEFDVPPEVLSDLAGQKPAAAPMPPPPPNVTSPEDADAPEEETDEKTEPETT